MEKVVRVFRSLKEADEADRRYRQSLTPEQRVEIFLALQQRDAGDQKIERVCRVGKLSTLKT